MITTAPLIPAVFIRRYQRFLADVELDGQTVTVHVPNTGSMLTLQESGVTAWLRPALPGRKLPFTLVLLGLPAGGLALVDTAVPNALVAEAVTAGAVPELAGYATHRREVAYGSRGSRIDLLLQHPDRPVCHVEVKNVTMRSTMVGGRADFPDARSERGAKHLAELADVARSGGRAVQFYLLSRDDCDRVGFAGGIDPLYAQAAREARDAGVEFLAYRARLAADGLGLGERCRIEW